MLVLVLTQNNHLNSSDYDCDVQVDDGGDGDDGADVLLRYGEVFAQLSVVTHLGGSDAIVEHHRPDRED